MVLAAVIVLSGCSTTVSGTATWPGAVLEQAMLRQSDFPAGVLYDRIIEDPGQPDGAGEPDSGAGETDGGGVGEDGTGYSYPGGAGRVSSDASGEVLRARRGLDLCPVCGMHGLAYEEGCLKCRSCGYSEC